MKAFLHEYQGEYRDAIANLLAAIEKGNNSSHYWVGGPTLTWVRRGLALGHFSVRQSRAFPREPLTIILDDAAPSSRGAGSWIRSRGEPRRVEFFDRLRRTHLAEFSTAPEESGAAPCQPLRRRGAQRRPLKYARQAVELTKRRGRARAGRPRGGHPPVRKSTPGRVPRRRAAWKR